MFMARTFTNPRLTRSSILLLFSTVLFVVPMHSQHRAADPVLAESGVQAAPVNQESNRLPTPDPKPQVSSPGTPEEIRHARIEADTKRLFQLSAELRAEVAKTYKESLSLSVLKKAEEIEKLARSLKALMSQEAATGH